MCRAQIGGGDNRGKCNEKEREIVAELGSLNLYFCNFIQLCTQRKCCIEENVVFKVIQYSDIIIQRL